MKVNPRNVWRPALKQYQRSEKHSSVITGMKRISRKRTTTKGARFVNRRIGRVEEGLGLSSDRSPRRFLEASSHDNDVWATAESLNESFNEEAAHRV